MGKIMRNDIPYCVGGDDAFRYVNDVTDENYGWIQYQLEDGNWVNYKQVGFGANYIIQNGVYNEEAFPFTINPTVQHYQMSTVETENGFKFIGVDTYAAHKYACFEMMDWSAYSKVKMNVLSYNRNDCFIGITSNADLHEYNLELSNLTQLNINAEGELEMDISAINSNGRLYIRVITDGYVEFTDLHFE